MSKVAEFKRGQRVRKGSIKGTIKDVYADKVNNCFVYSVKFDEHFGWMAFTEKPIYYLDRPLSEISSINEDSFNFNIKILLGIIKDAQKCYDNLNWSFNRHTYHRLNNHKHNFKKITGKDLDDYLVYHCPA